MEENSKRYRRNVAIVVLNDAGKLLACHRSDTTGIWQLPQGGVDEGEELEAAMYRELEEEIGTRAVELLGSLEHSIHYDWPEELYSRGYHGQEQYYYLVRLLDESSIDLHCGLAEQEFDKVEWLAADEFLSRVTGFKLAPYTTALTELQKKYPQYFDL